MTNVVNLATLQVPLTKQRQTSYEYFHINDIGKEYLIEGSAFHICAHFDSPYFRQAQLEYLMCLNS